MRFGGRVWITIAGIAALLCGIGVWACAGGDEDYPRWALVTKEYSPYGASALLSPGNDTRVNLLLLLADRRPADGLIRQPEPGKPNALFRWADLAARVEPAKEDSSGYTQDWREPSRCQSNTGGAAAFAAAVKASSAVPAGEKEALIAAREAIDPWTKPGEKYEPIGCGAPAPAALPAVSSPAAREFASYLSGAAKFYAGDFPAARRDFAGLAQARDPWVRETAIYMVARTDLNAAQQSAFDEYGSLTEPEKRDLQAIRGAGRGFDTYLAAFPSGRYTSSARGLLRRVAWLEGDTDKLSTRYSALLAGKGTSEGFADNAELAEEIDLKLFADLADHRVSGPVLLAVADLQRMREPAYECSGRMMWCGKAITEVELEAQREEFGSDTELYDYIRAAHAFFVRHQPADVVKIIPDAARQPSFTYVQFSRQLLRGLALEALGDRNARGLMLEVFGGASRPFQRDALELAIAMHDEKAGNLGRVFAPDAKVRNPFIREILLERIAGPDLLRQQARAGLRQQERDAALYILLVKELRHGLYSNFLADVRLVPAGAPTDGYFYGVDTGSDYPLEPHAKGSSDDQPERTVPLGIFTRHASVGEFGCPALAQTVSVLAREPRNIRARLCLGEFMRAGSEDTLDPFTYDNPIDGGGLASSRPLFPGPAFLRLDAYKSVIADRGATPEEKAFALNRAIRCYAPSRYNHCGGTDVEQSQRRAWFLRLKADYPKSPWAKSLKYYW